MGDGIIERLCSGAGSRTGERFAGTGMLVCEECGRIQPLEDVAADRALRRFSRHLSPARAEYELTIYGLCDRCT